MEMEKEKEKTKRIVVAVDESEESMHALSWCLKKIVTSDSHDHHNNTTLILLYVKPPPPIHSFFDAAGFLFSGHDVVATMEKYSCDLVNSVMERAQAVYGSYGELINVERVVGKGDAKDVICIAVDKLKADTLVMGTHGYGFMKRALLGSVSDYCAKHVKCPVVIVKPSEDQ